MAADRFLDTEGLRHLWEKIKAWIPFLSRKTQSIPFGQVDSTSTSTVFTATVNGITELRDGVFMYLRNGVVNSASGFTININGLGAKPVYQNIADAARVETGFQKAKTFLFAYNSTRVSGGCWDIYYGISSVTSDTNSIGYQVRTNSSTLPAKFKTYRYRLLFTSADGNYYVGANASTSTNATAVRTPTTEKIDPFGRIVYYSTTSAVNANANFSTAYLYQQITFILGYSFNSTGVALVLDYPKPVYIKCAPQTDGSAIIDATTPYVQSLPSTEDGKIYIFLGLAYSATAVELTLEHPVYYYKDGAIRIWANEAAQDDTNFVHRTGNETIAGIKTFNDDVNIVDSSFVIGTNDQNKHNVYMNLDNYHDDGGDGIAVLALDDPSGQGDVVIRSVAKPIQQKDAANKKYVDDTENSILLNGYVGIHTLGPGDLFAFGMPSGEDGIMHITPFRYGLPNVQNINWIPVSDYSFPIGCKIYYNPNYLTTPNTEVVSGLFYSSFKNVPVYNNAITPSTVNLGVSSNSAVFLRVLIESNRWKPFYSEGTVVENLVSLNQLLEGNFYIYLGRTIDGNSMENVNYFQLEDNNPLYYFNGKILIDWASYIANSVGVTDYDDLYDKPQINGVTLSGNKTSSQLGLQSELTFDNTPTANSNNPVKSGGVKTALDAKQDTLVSGTNIKTVNNTSLLGSGNIQINDGVGFQTITTQQDGTMQITLTNGDTITVDLNHVHPQYYSKVVESVMPQGGFLPDVVYSLGVLSSNTTFTLAPIVIGNVNHYYWTFSTSTTAITITWPTKLIWANGSAPTIAANKHYEISILDSIAVYTETSIQEVN